MSIIIITLPRPGGRSVVQEFDTNAEAADYINGLDEQADDGEQAE